MSDDDKKIFKRFVYDPEFRHAFLDELESDHDAYRPSEPKESNVQMYRDITNDPVRKGRKFSHKVTDNSAKRSKKTGYFINPKIPLIEWCEGLSQNPDKALFEYINSNKRQVSTKRVIENLYGASVAYDIIQIRNPEPCNTPDYTGSMKCRCTKCGHYKYEHEELK